MRTLSGRLLILTAAFVMLAEVLIFVPSVARFRQDYLMDRLQRAQIASLALLADEMIAPELEQELLANAGVFNVVLRRDQVRQLALSSPIPSPIVATYDMRDPAALDLIVNAMTTLVRRDDAVIRVIGDPVREAGQLIEVTMDTGPLRDAMIEYGIRILILSAAISIVTALLLFGAIRRLVVTPIKGLVAAMESYAGAPEDARRTIAPRAKVQEIRQAETTLRQMQTQLTAALRQKDRLAQLGSAVAKISHDLRNVLTTAQLFADRLEGSQDPTAARMVPKLLGSISRAISICEGTLAFGRADEPPPALGRVSLARVAGDVIEGERLAVDEAQIAFVDEIPPGLEIRADAEQLFRILSNLVRNARQAIAATGQPGRITVSASETAEAWLVTVSDTGPGLPARTREHLFQPFQTASGQGGTGLGLTIAHDLVRGHGGVLRLARTGPDGTAFELGFPKSVVQLDAAE